MCPREDDIQPVVESRPRDSLLLSEWVIRSKANENVLRANPLNKQALLVDGEAHQSGFKFTPRDHRKQVARAFARGIDLALRNQLTKGIHGGRHKIMIDER